MSSWDPGLLARIDDQAEMTVAAHRPDGGTRMPRIVWHVVVDGHLFIRSVRGADGAWYRGVVGTGSGVVEAGRERVEVTFTADDGRDGAVDRAYHDKYGDGSAVRSITSARARATTLRVEPT